MIPLLRAKTVLNRISRTIFMNRENKTMLHISSLVSLFDSIISIKAENLIPGEEVELRNELMWRKSRFRSYAKYRADPTGIVDVGASPAISGSYTGVEPMGLFWSLSADSQSPGSVFMPRDAEDLEFELSLHRDKEMVEKRNVRRVFFHPDVGRERVNSDGLRGVFLYPKNPKHPLPGILDIYGTGGGLPLYRAALLASHGFAVLSLSVFAYADLPKNLDNGVNLEYFLEGLRWLEKHPLVYGERLGAIGASFGAIISMLASINFHKLKAVVSVNGFHMLDALTPIRVGGEAWPTVRGNVSLIRPETDGLLHYRYYRETMETEREAVFPLEDASPDTKFLFLVGGDDQCSPTARSAQELSSRLERFGRKNWEVEVYKDAGHLLEVPYLPLVHNSYHRILGHQMAWGGQPLGHSRAQEKMWRKILDHFKNHVGSPEPMRQNID